MLSSDLLKWPIFRLLETNFLSNIHMTFVYGPLGEQALIVTKNQDVYAIGSNSDSCLGIGHNFSTVYPKKIEILCGQDIKTFRCGNSLHILALTKSGRLYSWGSNTYGQLGNGNVSSPVPFPLLVKGSIGDQNIVDIACGNYHSLALTSEGEVYAWGQNTYGQVGGQGDICNIPRKVIFKKSSAEKVSCISCCAFSNVAVTHNGDVYVWGQIYCSAQTYKPSLFCQNYTTTQNAQNYTTTQNAQNYTTTQNAQKYSDASKSVSEPIKITGLDNIAIAKIVCGHSHVLALSTRGDLYAWGSNSHGQLACDKLTAVQEPKKIQMEKEKKIYDIASSHHHHISVAKIYGNQIFMWGECLGRSIMFPKFVSVGYMDDVFAYYASHRITYEPIVCSEERYMNLGDCLREAFDNPATSDVVINVRGQPIYAHKAVLRIRSQYFRDILKENSSLETDMSTIQHSQFSYDVYKAFLKYLYTAKMDLCIEDTIELLALADIYLESDLKESCISAISAKVTIENVATVYVVAVQRKIKKLQHRCLSFMCDHMTAVVQTESFSKLDQDTVKNFLIAAAKAGLFQM